MPLQETGTLSRRGFLALASCCAAAVIVPQAVAAAPHRRPATRRLSLHNLHTEERLEVVYWERGEYLGEALGEIDAILRDHRTGEIRQMAPPLLDLVHDLTLRLGTAEPIRVVSGYRSPATNAMLRAEDASGVARQSLHLSGEAIDLSFGGRSLRRVRDAALALRGGGVGYYPSSGFVHLDVGRPRRW